MSASFTHDDVPPALPPDLTLCLFRIAQEALQNAAKYSGAQHVAVHLSGKPDGLVLTIMDDGVGFDVDRAWGKGIGLVSMAERARSVGGQLSIRIAAWRGTSWMSRCLKAAVLSQTVASSDAVPILHSALVLNPANVGMSPMR
jgi:signal transduction histidine kinase